MRKAIVSIGVLLGLIALLYAKVFSIETVKPFSPPDSLGFSTITIRDTVTTERGESVTVFKDGHAIPGERFNKELLHTEFRDGWERIRGVLSGYPGVSGGGITEFWRAERSQGRTQDLKTSRPECL